MITCHLQGGLCNQLFQIFAVIAYAIRTKNRFVFTYTEMLFTGKPRKTYWENLLVSLKTFTTDNSFYQLSNNDLNNFPLMEIPFHNYQEIPEIESGKNVMLKGYFQSYRYFEKEREIIYSLIRLDKHLSDVRTEYKTYFIDKKYTVGIHFRLGDYKLSQECHNILPYEYYKNSIYCILSKLPTYEGIKFLYFCEEEDNLYVNELVERLKKHFEKTMEPPASSFMEKQQFNLSFVKVSDSIVDWKQMLLMACCDSNIIANSSFSWWGAYINNKKDKIVCYPSKWFGPYLEHNYMGDMFPSDWNVIQV